MAGTLSAFVAVLSVAIWRYRRSLRGKARAMLRERSLEECLAEIDDKLVAARRAPVDPRAAKVEVGMLEHMRSALLLEAGKGLPKGRIKPRDD